MISLEHDETEFFGEYAVGWKMCWLFFKRHFFRWLFGFSHIVFFIWCMCGQSYGLKCIICRHSLYHSSTHYANFNCENSLSKYAIYWLFLLKKKIVWNVELEKLILFFRWNMYLQLVKLGTEIKWDGKGSSERFRVPSLSLTTLYPWVSLNCGDYLRQEVFRSTNPWKIIT